MRKLHPKQGTESGKRAQSGAWGTMFLQDWEGTMTETPEAYLARLWPMWCQGLREAAGTLGVGILLPSRTGRPKFPCNSFFFFLPM